MACNWWPFVVVVAVLLGCLREVVKCQQPPAVDSADDPYRPEAIMSGKDGKGKLGDWKQWTNAHYNIYDQCWPNSYGGREEGVVFGSYALYFEWLGMGGKDAKQKSAENSSLLICYPSMADPKTGIIPRNGKAPLKTALFAQITNDPNNTISKKCGKLKKKCKEDVDCSKEMKNGEIWHAVMIERVQGKFRMKVPFDERNGKSFVQNIPMKQDFFLVLGTREEYAFWKTSLVHGVGQQQFRMSWINFESEEKGKVKDLKRLNALGTDILPPDGERIRFYTEAEPNLVEKKVCKMNVNKSWPERVTEFMHEFIHATFLKPTTPKTELSITRWDGGKTGDGNGEDGKEMELIKVNQMPGRKTEPIDLNSYLPHTRFYFKGKLPAKGTFSIRVVHGIAEPTENLGEIVLQIMATFDAENDLMNCTIYFLV